MERFIVMKTDEGWKWILVDGNEVLARSANAYSELNKISKGLERIRRGKGCVSPVDGYWYLRGKNGNVMVRGCGKFADEWDAKQATSMFFVAMANSPSVSILSSDGMDRTESQRLISQKIEEVFAVYQNSSTYAQRNPRAS